MEEFKYFNEIFKRFFKLALSNVNFKCVVILHTFGKDMKFHPHLHIIINQIINFNSNFNKLWRLIILKNLNINSNSYSYGFYVWSSRRINKRNLAKYIARYVRHPAVADSRILNYNSKHISFFYRRNEKKVIVVKQVDLFIFFLIQHIPPNQFKMIRYYRIITLSNNIITKCNN